MLKQVQHDVIYNKNAAHPSGIFVFKSPIPGKI
jgi:hypothetical protein